MESVQSSLAAGFQDHDVLNSSVNQRGQRSSDNEQVTDEFECYIHFGNCHDITEDQHSITISLAIDQAQICPRIN